MARRTRILAFGSAAVLALAGALCSALVQGVTGLVIGLTLLSLGLGGLVLLVFLEIGLSEDHARAREEQRRPNRAQRPLDARHSLWSHRPPRRPG